MMKVVSRLALFATLPALLSGCFPHPINRVRSQPNGFLPGDSSLILEDRTESLSVLFPNGLVLFAGKDLLENPKRFMHNNIYECRYCWGRYQYQNQRLTVFKPLPSGYLNLPDSYPIEQLKYRIIDGKMTSLSDPNGQIVMQKAKLFINPNRAWLATKGALLFIDLVD